MDTTVEDGVVVVRDGVVVGIRGMWGETWTKDGEKRSDVLSTNFLEHIINSMRVKVICNLLHLYRSPRALLYSRMGIHFEVMPLKYIAGYI